MSGTYTIFGQLVILVLIQIGGMGYMTMSSYIFYRLTHHCAKISNNILSTSVAAPSGMSIRTLMSNIVLFTFAFEGIGFILLYIFLLPTGVEKPMWDAFFLSISSFCTAGFSPHKSRPVLLYPRHWHHAAVNNRSTTSSGITV